MAAILTVAHLTLSEARRRRLVAAACICAATFLVVFGSAVFFALAEWRRTPRPFLEEQGSLMAMSLAGLYAANFLSVLFAVLLPVDTLSGEIDSGVMQTLASKPIRRSDILLGKWLGHAILVLAYLVALVSGVLLTVRGLGHYAPAHVMRAVSLMALEMVLLLTVSMAGGTRLSTVTNGVAALGFYGVAFVGGWIEEIGALGRIHSARTIGIVASLVSPPDAMWRLAAYIVQPSFVRDATPVVFSVGSIPSPAMVWWTAGFTLATLAWAVRSFARRPL